jgi:diadenosine tetraphosphatase ApaH/serine/threonine PP2A family protein phosphatase
MKVAALYDVHGNLPALDAVLSEVDAGHHVLCGGDLVAGPMPGQCLERLRERGATFIRGNTDRAVAGGAGGDDDPWAERIRWVREQLSEEQLAFVRQRPHPLSLEVDGLGPVLFCHGSPRSDEEIMTAITAPKRLDPILDGVREQVIVCGHTHVQFDRIVGDRRLVNAGSVGMPYEGEAGIACWALLGPHVELRRSRYDVGAAARAMRASGYPDVDDFLEEYIVAPASADEATAHFEGLADPSL